MIAVKNVPVVKFVPVRDLSTRKQGLNLIFKLQFVKLSSYLFSEKYIEMFKGVASIRQIGTFLQSDKCKKKKCEN